MDIFSLNCVEENVNKVQHLTIKKEPGYLSMTGTLGIPQRASSLKFFTNSQGEFLLAIKNADGDDTMYYTIEQMDLKAQLREKQ